MGFELAVHLPSLESLQRQTALAASPTLDALRFERRTDLERLGWAAAVKEAVRRAGHGRIARIYFGSEVCPALAPTEEQARAAGRWLAQAGIAGSFVAGVVTERDFAAALATARAFAQTAPAPEIVANDWGFAAAVASSGLEVELGRFLFKAKRMPRSAGSPPRPDLPEGTDAIPVVVEQVSQLAEHPADAPWFVEFARRVAGNCRVQTEVVPQGLRDRPAPPLPATLLVPWTYVTGGGQCPLFPAGPEGCTAVCKDAYVVPEFRERYLPMVQAGRAVFLQATGLIATFSSMARFDRIALEPGLPL